MRKVISTVFSFCVALFGITFAFLNSTPVSLNYYVGVIDIPLSMLLIAVLCVGALFGLFVGRILQKRKK